MRVPSAPNREPSQAFVTPDNLRYLRTKRDRMGHDLRGLSEADKGAKVGSDSC